MQVTTNNTSSNLLQLIPFSNVELWDVKRYASNKIQSNYPIVKLGMHIQEESRKVKLFDFPEEEFGILGVNNKVGIFDAYKEQGANINQSYKKMEAGWLAYNPYRINVGSIGMRTTEQQHEFISPAYVVFSCKDNLLPDFLYKLFKTERFNKIINDSTTGSVRQNLTIDILKTLDIPLPKPVEQDNILRNYYSVEEEAISKENEISIIENKIEVFINSELNISFKRNLNNKGLSFISSTSLNRWDVAYLSTLTKLESKYASVTIESCLSSFLKDHNRKSLRFNSVKYPNKEFYFIGMEHVEKNSGELQELISVKGNEIKSQTIQVPKDFILYGKLRPYLNKFWVNKKNDENIICSSEFFVFNTNETINKDYFLHILGSTIIQHQIRNNSSGARMPRINEETFKNLQIPLPTLKIQNDISYTVQSFKDDIRSLKENILKLREKALKEFEQAIF